MSDSELIPSHHVPMSDVCDNLVSAWALTACYFELDARMAASPEELLHVLNKAHTYLVYVHMGILRDFKLVDSRYGLSLHTLICILVGCIPFEQRPLAWRRWFLTDVEMDRNDYKLDESFSLPGEEGYEVNVASLSTSASSPMSVAPPKASVPLPSIPMGPTNNQRPRPTMIKMLEPPKAPSTSRSLIPPLDPSLLTFLDSYFLQSRPGRSRLSDLPRYLLWYVSLVAERFLLLFYFSQPAPLASKRKHVQGSAVQLLADDSMVKKSTRFTKSSAPIPSIKLSKPAITRCGTRTSAGKAKVAPAQEPPAVLAKIQMLAHSSGNIDLSDSGDDDSTLQDIARHDSGQETEEVMAQPIKRVRLVSPAAVSPPPVHVYHPLTGEPLTGLTYVSLSALSEPVQPFPVAGTSSKGKSKGKARVAALPAPAVVAPVSPVAAIVDNTIYARGFHLDINLQFHEPPSCEALERMKMSLLPAAPESLTKPPLQVRSGQEYVYHCHSDPNPYFIRAPLLNWPCFNCTLAGMLDECIFEGGVGEECCTRCKSNRHGPCSAGWDANQLCSTATLLDPLTLSGDGGSIATCLSDDGADEDRSFNDE
ncbi:hypothetical protein IW261DRAFT_1558096 [Armillaria novae-zelandiae]|uniref:Uncharacterized protein n=1 Tax=Armillaria novae-zelandiae TaxID=153914 RepID=A0AA39UH39_9AGAR|nr:hypothetical protein IW261DRAFT_1558096 [Armillaria novae-zelandiae]